MQVLRLDVSHLTVDKLKSVIRALNSRIKSNLKVSGNKGELINRIREEIESRRDRNDVTAYAWIRRELVGIDAR